MKAYNLQNQKEYYAQPADQYTQMILSAAEYYIDQGPHILLLIPADKIDAECFYRYFDINGEAYFSIVTQSHDGLVQIFNNKKYRQERLF